jgi:epoxyqueuosine reductase
VILVGRNYCSPSEIENRSGNNSSERAATETDRPGGRVAKYATGTADYHDILKRSLKDLATALHELRPGCRTRAIVDTAPLLERDFARLAGLGWFGKNTMLINIREGSWFFLGALLTDLALPPDQPHHTAHCGTCTRCLDACPTDAFPEPYVLDATRCISYLTIELRDQPVPTDLRPGLGDWLFGCDVCQDVCPWNRKAPDTTEVAFQPAGDLTPVSLDWLLSLDEMEFQRRFRRTPLERPGRSGLLRNAAIVAGNSGDLRFIPVLTDALRDPQELIRGAAAWALGELGHPDSATSLEKRLVVETSQQVQSEIHTAVARIRHLP